MKGKNLGFLPQENSPGKKTVCCNNSCCGRKEGWGNQMDHWSGDSLIERLQKRSNKIKTFKKNEFFACSPPPLCVCGFMAL